VCIVTTNTGVTILASENISDDIKYKLLTASRKPENVISFLHPSTIRGDELNADKCTIITLNSIGVLRS